MQFNLKNEKRIPKSLCLRYGGSIFPRNTFIKVKMAFLAYVNSYHLNFLTYWIQYLMNHYLLVNAIPIAQLLPLF